MSDQFPPPGQPGEQPPTQMAPSGGAPGPAPYGAPQPPQQPGYPPAGGYPAPGYPGGPGGPGYPGGPGGYPAPPTGGGGSKKGLIIGIIAGVVVLVLIVVAILAFTVFKGDDDDPKKVSEDPTTSESTDATSSPSPSESESFSDFTESPTDDGGSGGVAPTDDPTITARAFLDSLLTGECLAVEGLSTPEYFASEFTDQPGCKKVAGNLEMSNAEYTFQEPIVVGTFATVNGDVYAPNTGKTLVSTWLLDGTTGEWLVSGYSYTTDE